MAWCCQATSHYLNQCWPRSMSPYGVTRPQWVNLIITPVVLMNLICNMCSQITLLKWWLHLPGANELKKETHHVKDYNWPFQRRRVQCELVGRESCHWWRLAEQYRQWGSPPYGSCLLWCPPCLQENFRQISNIRHTKSQILTVSDTVRKPSIRLLSALMSSMSAREFPSNL